MLMCLWHANSEENLRARHLAECNNSRIMQESLEALLYLSEMQI